MKKMMYILGDVLAKDTGLQGFLCMGMMRMSIEVKCGSTDVGVVDAFMDTMGFRDWETVLKDENLAKRLGSNGVKNVPAVIEKAKKTLVERQSLFTMSAK